jgi:hypothetical protein
MTFKEFFRFNLKKIVISLFLLSILVLLIFQKINLKSGAESPISYKILEIIFTLPVYLLEFIVSSGTGFIYVAFILIVEIFYLYLLACIIYSLIFRKKKVQQNL